MKRFKQALILAMVGLTAFIIYTACHICIRVAQIPDAYAAWDTGTLLVAYMESNHDEWPASWDDLVGLVKADTKGNIPLRGAGGNRLEYAESLMNRVFIDWAFDPRKSGNGTPVTRLDGSALPKLWANPNAMVREYFLEKPQKTGDPAVE